MPWLSDILAKAKSLYQQLVHWERMAFLREQEWLLPVYGTADEFEQRFKVAVSQIPRDDFFRLSSWTEDHEAFGFCIDHEMALKVARPTITGFLFLFRPVYHFHGSLIQNNGQHYLYGENRADRLFVNWVLPAANFYYLFCAAWLVVAVVAVSLDLPMDAETKHMFGNIVQPIFVAGVWTLMLIFYSRFYERWARPVHTETHRILADICGSPTEPSSNQIG